MRELLLGVVLIILLGVGGFFYRNAMEQLPRGPVAACTMEAKVCPDGSAVGRQGPSCEFAPCPPPNAESKELRISYVVPEGYVADGSPLGITYTKPALGGEVYHTIHIRSYGIPAGQSANDVILAHTRYQPADMQAEDFSRFSDAVIDDRTYRFTIIERFEALVHSVYFLPRETDILAFEIIEHDVTGWMDADLNVHDLPEHAALEQMLGTLQTSP